MNTLYFIFIFLAKSCLCQDKNKLFGDINKEYNNFNAISASLSWESSVNPGKDLQSQTAEYQKELISWQQRTCDKLLEYYSRGLFNSTETRQMYLLCRGPKFTYDEARLSSKLYEELQSIYTNAEVCIPTAAKVNKNDLEAIESAILHYLITVKNNFKTNDYITYAAKITTYSKWDKGNAFCIQGEDEFEQMTVYSKVEEVLRWLWLVWREKVGPPIKEPYRKFVNIENQAARRNGYSDIGSSWRKDLEIPNLRRVCRRLYENILPMYKMLHGVARFYLRKHYGDIVPEKGPIPAHLLGDLWSQNWEPLAQLILKESIDLNHNIKVKNWTISHMVKRAEDFFISIGLPPMTETFWSESVFERQNNSMRCHGTAADMFKKGDFRMLYCIDISMEDFYGLHHELGHIQYYMAYEKQPAIFRQANAAFHEAIGDTIMLGVITPQHLHRLGLINDEALYNVDIRNTVANITPDNSLSAEDIKYMRKKRQIVYNNKVSDITNYTGKVYVDKGIITKPHTQKMKINQKKNHGVCNKTNTICYKREPKRSKRVRRDEDTYEKINNKTNEHEILNIKDSKQVKLLNKDMNDLYSIHKRQNIKISPIQEVYLYSGSDKKVAQLRENYKSNNMVKELKNLGINKDSLEIEYIKENIQDNPLFNMKLDDVLMFKQALNKIPQIPFALLIDEYRWKYFEGNLKKANGNFWKMALELQGIAPPEFRGEEYFDAGAKFHVPDNTPYIRYFLSSFLQYQLFETLCKAAVFGRRNSEQPLPETISMNRCDIYGSKTVGKILLDFMSRGNSQDWRDILQGATGQREISSAALQRYYRPLFHLLRKLVRKYSIPIGW